MKLFLTANSLLLPAVFTAAFSPSSKITSTSERTDDSIKTSLTAALVSDDYSNKNKPIFDPLGLYPKNSPERLNGLIQPLESFSIVEEQQDANVVDPLGLYGKNTDEQKSGMIKPLESSRFFRSLANIFAFSRNSDNKNKEELDNASLGATLLEDLDFTIQGTEAALVKKPIYDPLGLYPKTAPERVNGLIQPLEASVDEEQDMTIIDPLSLYLKSGKIDEVTAGADQMSSSIPFLKRPDVLDGSFVGDLGFDPFKFSSDKASLEFYRSAEIKHSRLAMLAAVGWPVAELFHSSIAQMTGFDSFLMTGDRVPSILNGGLSQVPIAFWVVALSAAAILETVDTVNKNFLLADEQRDSEEQGDNNLALASGSGDFGFDPLILGGETEDKKFFIMESELFHGRLAMLAITAYAAQEWLTQTGVVHQLLS